MSDMFGERVLAGERIGSDWRVRGARRLAIPFTESVDFEPEIGEGRGRGGTGGRWGKLDMGTRDAAVLVLRELGLVRGVFLCFELVTECTDLTSPSLTAVKRS